MRGPPDGAEWTWEGLRWTVVDSSFSSGWHGPHRAVGIEFMFLIYCNVSSTGPVHVCGYVCIGVYVSKCTGI